MTRDILPCVELEPPGPARASVIWLHGLGADGHDFEPVVPALGLPTQHGVRFLFPHAPRIPVTVNRGWVMRAWYDIVGLQIDARQDEAGIRRSAAQLGALVDRERERGIASEAVVLAGFSQGGAIALHTGLRYPEPLAGILALSTYVPLADSLPGEATAANRAVPIFMGHGEADGVIPLEVGARARDRLVAHGCRVEWHSYPIVHGVSSDEIGDIGRWLAQVLGLTASR